ncbi:cytosolic endo-beta-N-acetylglucosaminidase isoform X2 [Emydura macquarii macquarii]|uniref:cytosolic endo-beta-N-acetylglucosaminidase isoform X2 n=1 Tax=Emydura macquarii macquarii TaxID=1129001 RepID=UPI003529DA4E
MCEALRPCQGGWRSWRRRGAARVAMLPGYVSTTCRLLTSLLPARHFDRDTTEPISFYLSSLEELLAWKPTGDDDFNVATMPLAKRQPPLHSKRPRTLVCHDMKNGYLEDRFIQGSASRDPYIFYHWQYIDIFVYFSHHTVTIPPVTWTNAAHRNGVSVLGTFITEWTDGGKLCESFLAGEADGYCAVAEQLVHIASFYCFDGWLVNIENRLSEAAVRNLPFFLRHLRERLQRVLPGGLVLWYDSVLQSGELKWQNELNEKNRVFFDACDGLFTNYNWQEEHLERTRAQAGERLADVYVGVDVFARGEVVGGGFETDKVLGFADGAAAHSQHRHAAFQHLLLPGHGHGTVLGWAGGRSRALVQSERPGDPTPLHRPPSRAGDGWLAAHVLLPAGRLERGQLPADRGGHPPCRGPRGCPPFLFPDAGSPQARPVSAVQAGGVARGGGRAGAQHTGHRRLCLAGAGHPTSAAAARHPAIPPLRAAPWLWTTGYDRLGQPVLRAGAAELRPAGPVADPVAPPAGPAREALLLPPRGAPGAGCCLPALLRAPSAQPGGRPAAVAQGPWHRPTLPQPHLALVLPAQPGSLLPDPLPGHDAPRGPGAAPARAAAPPRAGVCPRLSCGGLGSARCVCQGILPGGVLRGAGSERRACCGSVQVGPADAGLFRPGQHQHLVNVTFGAVPGISAFLGTPGLAWGGCGAGWRVGGRAVAGVWQRWEVLRTGLADWG